MKHLRALYAREPPLLTRAGHARARWERAGAHNGSAASTQSSMADRFAGRWRREREANRIRKSKDIDDAKLERLMENEFGRISGNVALLDETELEELIEIESDGD